MVKSVCGKSVDGEVDIEVSDLIVNDNLDVGGDVGITGALTVTGLSTLTGGIKTDSIQSLTGGGTIDIEGVDLQAVGATVLTRIGDTSGVPVTNDATLSVEGDVEAEIIINSDWNGTGPAQDAHVHCQTKNAEWSAAFGVESTGDAMIKVARVSGGTVPDIIFRVNDVYTRPANPEDHIAPAGGSDALSIDGTNGNLSLLVSGQKVIFANGVIVGDSSTTGTTTSASVGKNCTITAGNTNTVVGVNNASGGTTSSVMGVNNTHTFTNGCVYGVGNTATGASNAMVFGIGNTASGGDNLTVGRALTNNTSQHGMILDSNYTGEYCGIFQLDGPNAKEATLGRAWSDFNYVEQDTSPTTLTADEVVNGVVECTQTGTMALTLPTGAALLTYLFQKNAVALSGTPGTSSVHSSFTFVVINNGTLGVTITLGAGNTQNGTDATAAIAAGATRSLRALVTNVGAFFFAV